VTPDEMKGEGGADGVGGERESPRRDGGTRRERVWEEWERQEHTECRREGRNKQKNGREKSKSGEPHAEVLSDSGGGGGGGGGGMCSEWMRGKETRRRTVRRSRGNPGRQEKGSMNAFRCSPCVCREGSGG